MMHGEMARASAREARGAVCVSAGLKTRNTIFPECRWGMVRMPFRQRVCLLDKARTGSRPARDCTAPAWPTW